MTSCHHHSGYLADDEAGHTTYVARPPKKPPFLEMGQAYKSGHIPHPPSRYTHADSSGLRGHRRNPRDPRPFGSFLDFLVEGQVLDSLQTVVEEATERMTTMKTEAGVPLVEVQDPIEVPRGGQRVRARPSLSTVHRHRARPSLCTGRPNNYPSSSSSMSDSHSSFTAGWLGSHSQDSDLGACGMGSLPPMRDKLLLEKNLKRLLKLENRGSPNYRFVKKTLPSISSKSTLSHFPNPVYEELVSYLVEKVVSLVIYKYKFEKNLSKQLGFISFPVTETLMDLFLGFKKVKGSRICLSSKINWNCLLRKLEEAEWARQLSRQASQHDSASQRSSHRGPAHQGAGHSSTQSPSTGPEPAPRADRAEATEPSLDSELPDLRLLWAQEDAGAEEQGPTSQQEPTAVGANQSQELVDGDSQSNEEEDEDQGEDFPDEGTPQSSPRASSGGGRQRLHEHESQ